jgi:hypothetical protein
MYRRLGGPQSRSGQVQKISPPPGIDRRTVQPVAIRYTDRATRPTKHICSREKNEIPLLPAELLASHKEFDPIKLVS